MMATRPPRGQPLRSPLAYGSLRAATASRGRLQGRHTSPLLIIGGSAAPAASASPRFTTLRSPPAACARPQLRVAALLRSPLACGSLRAATASRGRLRGRHTFPLTFIDGSQVEGRGFANPSAPRPERLGDLHTERRAELIAMHHLVRRD